MTDIAMLTAAPGFRCAQSGLRAADDSRRPMPPRLVKAFHQRDGHVAAVIRTNHTDALKALSSQLRTTAGQPGDV
jgi:hypothetical protein